MPPSTVRSALSSPYGLALLVVSIPVIAYGILTGQILLSILVLSMVGFAMLGVWFLVLFQRLVVAVERIAERR